MKFLFLALLPWLALIDAQEAGGRRLDATWVDPTEAPTKKAVVPKPTPSPTVSPAPSVSFAPTTPQAPECNGAWPFCYDGNGHGKGYTTCYTIEESEFCGVRDFMIVGMDHQTRGPYNFERCSNVWTWFLKCIESSYTSCERQKGGWFYYNKSNKPKTYLKYHNSKKKWEVKAYSKGISGAAKWYCELEDDARGIKHFADYVSGEGLFATPIGSCATPAPSESQAPSISLEPTKTPAPKCADTGMPPYMPAAGRYMGKRCKWAGTNHCVTVSNGCTYKTESNDIAGKSKEYDNPQDWFRESGPLFGGTPKDSNGELSGKPFLSEDVTFSECGDKVYCITFTGEGVTSDMVWSFTNKGYSVNFLKLWRTVFTYYPAVLDTHGDTKCGSGPYCIDDKDQTLCRIDAVSEHCGEYDFLVEGLGVYEKYGNVLDFFGKCVESLGCYVRTQGTFKGGQVKRKTTWDSGRKMNQLEFYGAGVGKKYEINCPGAEPVLEARKIWDEMYAEGLAVEKPWECTESPSESPTACSDSFFNNPPINIAIVIDTSFSTFEYKFGGQAKVGDLNNDGAKDTILDAEIAAVEALLDTILDSDELDNSNVDIGLITFNTEGIYEGRYLPLSDDNTQVNTKILDAIHSIATLKSGNDVLLQNIGFTNFDDALDKSIEYFNDPATPTDRHNLMVFLSDGKPNVRGDGDDEPWCPNDAGCVSGPDNLPDDADTPAWETGKLSFCHYGDTENCFRSGNEACARNDGKCLGAEAAKMYDSELAELNRLAVHRLSIGVGKESDVSVGSGLWMIDNNPMKTSHNVLPRQVLNSDDLITALRDLCPENTPNPTGSPSASPTDAPSVSPTPGPTTSPSASPTASPTTSPTEDYCDYNVIDFTIGEGDEPTGDGSVRPYEWQAYGMKINAITDELRDDGDAKRAFYYQTGNADAGKAIMIPEDDAGDSPSMNAAGGDIIITLDLTMDKFMKLDFFDVEDGASIATFDVDGNEVGEQVGLVADSGAQDAVVAVEGVYQIVVTIYGKGALTQMNVCRDPRKTPAPIGLAPEHETNAPSQSPTATACPDDIKLLGIVGDTQFDQLPIRIISQDVETVTVEISSAFTRDTEYLYTEHFDSALGTQSCVAHGQVSDEWSRQITLHCMESVPISIVRLLASDGSLSSGDDADVPECCDGPENDSNPKVLYTFQVHCETECI